MWLIDSRQQQAVEDITVIQALVLLFKFVMSEHDGRLLGLLLPFGS